MSENNWKSEQTTGNQSKQLESAQTTGNQRKQLDREEQGYTPAVVPVTVTVTNLPCGVVESSILRRGERFELARM